MPETVMGGVFGGSMAVRVGIRPITDDEGMRLVRIVRRGSGSVVTWRRAQILLRPPKGCRLAGSPRSPSPPRPSPRPAAQLQPRRVRLPVSPLRRGIKQLALSHPTDHGLPFSTWSLRKLADFLVAAGAVDDISHEGVRALLDEHGSAGTSSRASAAGELLAFLRYVRTLYPATTRIAIVLDNASAHLSTRKTRGWGTGRRPTTWS